MKSKSDCIVSIH